MTRILYLHGFASGPRSSKARYFRDRLMQAGARVEIPDLAAGDFEHLTIKGQLGVMENLAGGEEVSLIGSSLGGYLAALYAARHPEVRRVVLLAPGFAFGRRWPEWLGTQRMEEWRRNGTMEVFHYAENRNCRLAYELIEDAARYEDEPDFQQPCRIFHGSKDDVVPARLSEAFAASRPNVRLEIVESGHELLNVLEEIGAEVERFLLS
ncbi:MAG TPA: YqiA/YcfP family alpha/beta fold hydrolase [Bryobacteraceae bacterium]